ncbi:MAG: hypothetical protein ACE5EH_07970 [Gammaproteobacteria bacterium]
MKIHISVALITLLTTQVVIASQWTYVPSLNVGTEYDDNLRLTSEPHDSVLGISASPGISAGRVTDASSIFAGGLLKLSRFDSDEVKDTNEQHYLFSSRYKTLLDEFRVNSVLSIDTSITRLVEWDAISAEQIDGLDISDVDEGLVKVNVRRERTNVTGSWKRKIDDVMNVSARYRFKGVYYDKESGTGLVDSKRHTIQAGVHRRIDDQSNVGLTLRYSDYQVSNNVQGSESYELHSAYNFQIYSTLRANAGFGVGQTRYADKTTDSLLFDVGLHKQSELTSYSINAGRDLRGSGPGTLVESNRVYAKVTSKISPRLSYSINAYLFRNNSIGVDSVSDRLFFRLEPALLWDLAQFWQADARYRYRFEDLENTAGNTKSNAILLSISYVPNRK